ncbi:hypothetical protein GcM1_215046 [Golovinomyces cichoracearum]|uniref:Uncharacterized protein n=1 Tax=Golovinomyces cichoracearum TaxID=62708 RepID=A0A420ITW6_9PEZI|nr:hypothetical protein GcM1_215046 [Golovinomyces cichoracearum]
MRAQIFSMSQALISRSRCSESPNVRSRQRLENLESFR